MKKSILAESRTYGWASAETAPPQIKARIVEIRRAILAGKPIPAPSAEYRSFAEQCEKKLFPKPAARAVTPTPDKHLDTLRRSLDVLRIS